MTKKPLSCYCEKLPCVFRPSSRGCVVPLEGPRMQTSVYPGSVDARVPATPLTGEPVTGADVSRTAQSLRHLAIVRVSHWLFATGVLGLIASGSGILISHPRLYWGETGSVAMPSLIDLPLPMIIGPSVWNRPIHFFFAWFLVIGGLIYV